MSRHIVVLGEFVAGRWAEAFGDVVRVGDPIAAIKAATAEAVFWVCASDPISIKSLRRARPDLPMVAMSLRPDAQEAMAMFEAGAGGYWSVIGAGELVRSPYDPAVIAADAWMSPAVTAAIVALLRERADLIDKSFRGTPG